MKGLVCGAMTVLTRITLLLLFLAAWLPEISAQQPLLSFDLKGKPKKYEDKKLRSEKTGDKKWTIVRRFTQNGTTKFNWNFNAKMKLAEVLDRAKLAFKEDYNQLLPFYNYSLQTTSQDQDLDSVIDKTNTGILIHDLRNTWIDNLYMLMGQAYYYKNNLDTAYLTFQYINYLFAPKEKDGYDIPIGSNAAEGGNAFSISTKEKTGLANKVWSSQPSRNESFIWQIRTYLARDEMAEAGGMIETLKEDPFFPERLETDLREMQALYFYKQQLYDSSAKYLELALPNAANRQERARWEYLIGQLYERAGNNQQAQVFFDKAINHTLDPVLEVYARLNSIRQNKGDDKAIQENVDALVKMARREKYINYRDIILFAAAQMELERNNVAGAKALLLRATRYTNPTGDNSYKSRAFLMLGGLAYGEKNYKESKGYYDSVTVVDSSILSQALYDDRKAALTRVVQHLDVLERQDSLQRIAGMPEAAREAFVKKLAKQLRKQQGIKEEDPSEPGAANNDRILNAGRNEPPPDLFGNNAKGDWYFDNAGLKSKGFTGFKNKWGTRTNVDNWRRSAAVRQANNQVIAADAALGADPGGGVAGADGPADLSYEGLLKNLPLTDRQLTASNDSIEASQYGLGVAYMEGIEDYASAITTLEGFLERFPESERRPEALRHLYYLYTKMGLAASATRVATELKERYPGTASEQAVSHPKGSPEERAVREAMTRQYEKVYNLFIEGSFMDALMEKRVADSLYGKNYWTPQLLYIQSVYFIRQRLDDSAKAALSNIVNTYAGTPMAEKAKTLIDVLSRRQQIEDYLTKLQIERPKEDSMTVIDDSAVTPVVAEAPKVDTPVVEEQARIIETDTKAAKIKGDSTQKGQRPGIKTDQLKRDPLVVAATPIPVQPKDSAVAPPVVAKDSAVAPPVVAARDSAVAPPVVVTPPVKKDSAVAPPVVVTPPPVKKDSAVAPPVVAPPVKKEEPVVTARAVTVVPGKPAFYYDPTAPHMVGLVLTKVDPVYITEARNAFNRYNKERFAGRAFAMGNQPLSDTVRIMTISPFADAAAAIAYLEQVRKAAPGELIPWMPAAKYRFVILTEANLGILQQTRDTDTYQLFLQQMFPGKF